MTYFMASISLLKENDLKPIDDLCLSAGPMKLGDFN